MSTQKRIISSKLNYQNLVRKGPHVCQDRITKSCMKIKKVLPESENRSSKSDLSEREKANITNNILHVIELSDFRVHNKRKINMYMYDY